VKHFSKLVWSTATAFALVVAMGSPAAAQDKPQVFAGYQFINQSANGVSSSVPAGWFAGVAVPIGFPMLSVFGTVDGGYKTDSSALGDVSSKTHTIMGGVLYQMKAINQLTPEAHVGVGVAHSSFSLSPSNALVPDQSSNDGAIDFGGGVGLKLNDKFMAIFDIGYRRIMSTTAVNDFRLSIGIGFPIG
jgi:hypothetical protein